MATTATPGLDREVAPAAMATSVGALEGEGGGVTMGRYGGLRR
jgi:hypothetical protein